MKVSLTFDNGPDAATTPYVLDDLDRLEVKATFFMLGRSLVDERSRRLAGEVRARGHRIGNHTFSHKVFGTMARPVDAVDEIDRTQALLESLADEDKLFRPAGGGGLLGPHLMSRPAHDHLLAGGYSCVLWNSVPRDWEEPVEWVATALGDVRRLDWPVVVLHDLPTGAMKQTAFFIERAIDLGAEFTQDFPKSCTPIWRGETLWPMEITQ